MYGVSLAYEFADDRTYDVRPVSPTIRRLDLVRPLGRDRTVTWRQIQRGSTIRGGASRRRPSGQPGPASRRQLLMEPPPQESSWAQPVTGRDIMPVVEQAKGVIMANSRCDPDQAFEMLRRAAQLGNIELCDFAGMIVRNAAGVPGRRVLTGHLD